MRALDDGRGAWCVSKGDKVCQGCWVLQLSPSTHAVALPFPALLLRIGPCLQDLIVKALAQFGQLLQQRSGAASPLQLLVNCLCLRQQGGAGLRPLLPDLGRLLPLDFESIFKVLCFRLS